jgi:serine/threonine-protein kinase
MGPEEAGLRRESRRLRFADAAIEAEYRHWQVQSSVPFNRVGCWLAFVNWTACVVVGQSVGVHGANLLAVLVLPVFALIIVALLASYRRPLLRFMQPVTALSQFIAGAVLVGFTNWMVVTDPAHSFSYDLTIPATLISNYYGFAILRVTPRVALASVAPYAIIEGALAFVHVSAGRVNPHAVPFELLTLASGFVTGLVINVVLDLNSRSTFRQERIIEAQKETIAAERRKSEALLRQELGHQVAERSRELGRLLAREDTGVAPVDLIPGARFDARYTVVRRLGEGGMGAVYEVVRATDGEALALKVVTGRVSRADAIRFAREAEIGARLRHPNLVSIVDVGMAGTGAPFLVMELVKGVSLEARRGRFGEIPWAMPLLRQIASALAALHDAGIVHRDLKPANVLLSGDDASDASPVARISDYGISRLDDDVDARARTAVAATATNSMLGTPLYMAPETARGGRAAGPAADIYAFGIVAYEMLTGRSPFKVPPVILAMAGLAPPLPAAIDHPAGDVVLACLRAAPDERPPIHELIAGLPGASA